MVERLLNAFRHMRRSDVRADIVGAVVTTGLIGALTVVTGILQARLLGPAGRGMLVAIQAWPSVFPSFAMLGVQDAIVYFGARDPKHAGRYATSGTAIILLFAVPVAAASWVALPFLMPSASHDTLTTSRIYLGLIIVFAVNGLAVFLLRAVHSMRSWNMARLGPYVLWLVILLEAKLRHDTRPDHLALTFLATYAAYAVVLVFLIRQRLAGYWVPRYRVARDMLKYGLPVATASMPQLLNQRVDQLLVVSFLDIENLGYYAVAVSWASATSLAASAISSVAFPRISGVPGEQQRPLLKKVFATTVGVTLATAFVLALVGSRVIPLVFGPRFLAAVPVSYLLLVASTFRAINDSSAAGLKGVGYPGGVMAAELSGVVVSVPLLAVLVPRLSLIGAGLAAIAGAAVSCAVGIALLVRRTNADLRTHEA